jgi:2,5-diketo-D-gluconate reductase B
MKNGRETKQMEYVEYNGERIPALGLGTWQLKGGDCARVVAQALDIGYRHIDTAETYDNEHAVGSAVQASRVWRNDVFVTSKVSLENLHRDEVRRSVEQSLQRIHTKFIDLLLIHWPNEEVPLEETVDALLALREEGKIRHLGASNFTPSLMEKLVDLMPVACHQIEYHPFLLQKTHLELAREHGYWITAYAPLARGKVFEDPLLQSLGEKHGKSAGQIALRWLIQQQGVAAIPKASSPEHLQENFDIFDFELDDEGMEMIFSRDRGERIVDPEFAPAWGT